MDEASGRLKKVEWGESSQGGALMAGAKVVVVTGIVKSVINPGYSVSM